MPWRDCLLRCFRRGLRRPLSLSEYKAIQSAISEGDWLRVGQLLAFHWAEYDNYTPESRELLDTTAFMLRAGASGPDPDQRVEDA